MGRKHYLKKIELGISFIEICIALLLLSLGVLGSTALLAKSETKTIEAKWQFLTSALAFSIEQSLWFQQTNLSYWQENLNQHFPESKITSVCNEKSCTITFLPPPKMLILKNKTVTFEVKIIHEVKTR